MRGWLNALRPRVEAPSDPGEENNRQLLERLQTIGAEHPEAVKADLTLFFINRWVDGEQNADICP